MSTYFSMIFKVHHTIFGYDVCPKEYTNLLSRSISGITSKDIESMKDREEKELENNLNNNLTYSLKQQNIFASSLLLQGIQVFTILEAPYVSHHEHCRA